ncbi:MAG: phosphoenolpyruvate--protein phosphotransferase [Balneolaceae bacterium]
MTQLKEQAGQSVVLKGIAASGGIGIGKAWIMPNSNTVVKPEKISDEEAKREIDKVNEVVEYVINEFNHLKNVSDDEEIKNILDTQIQVLYDPQLLKDIRAKVSKQHFGSVYAIFESFNKYIELLDESGVDWAKERMIDIVSIRDQLIKTIKNKGSELSVAENSVVFAHDVSPTEMIQLSRQKIAGLIMQKGGLTSHAVILAQSLNIPCVIGTNWENFDCESCPKVLMDGDSGEIILNPNDEEQSLFNKRKKKQIKLREESLVWVTKPNETNCGSAFTLRANIEFLNELPRLKTHGAKGVGLLRTETVLFQHKNFDVDNQIQFYSSVLDAADGETVTIRLFDAGGDKLLDDYEAEANPFLGWRGIRMLLDKPVLLDQQLEAILRVSGEYPGKLKILVPMVSRLEEIDEVKQSVHRVARLLEIKNISFDKSIPLGIMIEVPSIALMADQAAEKVDFFSVGTNDLTQYTLAVDRGNENISKLFEPLNPSVWKLIALAKSGADKAGIPMAVCGEMASKPELAACFLGMGITELSMTTNSIPEVKAVLCNSSKKELQDLADKILSLHETHLIDSHLKKWIEGKSI